MTTLSVCNFQPQATNEGVEARFQMSQELLNLEHRREFTEALSSACYKHFNVFKSSPILLLFLEVVAIGTYIDSTKPNGTSLQRKVSICAAACGIIFSVATFYPLTRVKESNLSCTKEKTCNVCEKLFTLIKKKNLNQKNANILTLLQITIINLGLLGKQVYKLDNLINKKYPILIGLIPPIVYFVSFLTVCIKQALVLEDFRGDEFKTFEELAKEKYPDITSEGSA